MLYGDQGNDCLSGGLDADFFLGEAGDDILFGGRGNDVLAGEDGNNTLVGGLGRDLLVSGLGNNLCVLEIDPATTDINSSDAIASFDPDLDRIGLASGLTVNDIVLDRVEDVTFTYRFDGPQALLQLFPPDLVSGISELSSGTLIRVRNSNAILGFVNDVTPNELQSKIVFVQGF